MPAAAVCARCGSELLSTFGEKMTDILDMRLRRRKVLQSVREKVTCRGRHPIAALLAVVEGVWRWDALVLFDPPVARRKAIRCAAH